MTLFDKTCLGHGLFLDRLKLKVSFTDTIVNAVKRAKLRHC
jgi:hypothetical protein